jgi:hypothetical protein
MILLLFWQGLYEYGYLNIKGFVSASPEYDFCPEEPLTRRLKEIALAF